MHFRPFLLACDCGGHLPGRIRRVGLTPLHELVVHWWCPACKRTHYTVKALADCWRECPDRDDKKATAMVGAVLCEADAQFLHSLGVAFHEEEQV